MEWADITEEYASGLLNTDILLTANAIENTITSVQADNAPTETASALESDGEIAQLH